MNPDEYFKCQRCAKESNYKQPEYLPYRYCNNCYSDIKLPPNESDNKICGRCRAQYKYEQVCTFCSKKWCNNCLEMNDINYCEGYNYLICDYCLNNKYFDVNIKNYHDEKLLKEEKIRRISTYKYSIEYICTTKLKPKQRRNRTNFEVTIDTIKKGIMVGCMYVTDFDINTIICQVNDKQVSTSPENLRSKTIIKCGSKKTYLAILEVLINHAVLKKCVIYES